MELRGFSSGITAEERDFGVNADTNLSATSPTKDWFYAEGHQNISIKGEGTKEYSLTLNNTTTGTDTFLKAEGAGAYVEVSNLKKFAFQTEKAFSSANNNPLITSSGGTIAFENISHIEFGTAEKRLDVSAVSHQNWNGGDLIFRNIDKLDVYSNKYGFRLQNGKDNFPTLRLQDISEVNISGSSNKGGIEIGLSSQEADPSKTFHVLDIQGVGTLNVSGEDNALGIRDYVTKKAGFGSVTASVQADNILFKGGSVGILTSLTKAESKIDLAITATYKLAASGSSALKATNTGDGSSSDGMHVSITAPEVVLTGTHSDPLNSYAINQKNSVVDINSDKVELNGLVYVLDQKDQGSVLNISGSSRETSTTTITNNVSVDAGSTFNAQNTALKLSGASNTIKVKGTLTLDNASMALAGNSEATINKLNGSNAEALLDGAAKATITKFEAVNATFNLKGSSSTTVADLAATNTSLALEGTAKATLNQVTADNFGMAVAGESSADIGKVTAAGDFGLEITGSSKETKLADVSAKNAVLSLGDSASATVEKLSASGTVGVAISDSSSATISDLSGATSSISLTGSSQAEITNVKAETVVVSIDGSASANVASLKASERVDMEIKGDSTASIKELSGKAGRIVLYRLGQGDDVPLTVKQNAIHGLELALDSKINDSFGGDNNAAARKFNDSFKITDKKDPDQQIDGTHTMRGLSGKISDSWTAEVDEHGNVVITGTQTNQALDVYGNFAAMTFVHWRNEGNHINQRLGDVRDASTSIGAWARIYGYDSSYSDNVSIDYKANSIQVGGDYRLNETWLVGGAFSYTGGKGTFSNGSSEADGYTAAAYLSGFFPCGGYIDLIGRVGTISTDITAMSEGSTLKGSYDNTTLGLSVEVGHHFKLNDTFYVEPQAELTYGFIKGDDYTANGVKIAQDDVNTLVSRLGVRTGATFAEGAGTVFAHASVNHEFLGDTNFTATVDEFSRHFEYDINGTWVSYGVGAQFNTSANLNFYGTLERSNGSTYQEDYRYSVGMSYRF